MGEEAQPQLERCQRRDKGPGQRRVHKPGGVSERHISFLYLWWSRSDIGLLERLGIPPKPPGQREETLVNLVARKPE